MFMETAQRLCGNILEVIVKLDLPMFSKIVLVCMLSYKAVAIILIKMTEHFMNSLLGLDKEILMVLVAFTSFIKGTVI